MKRIVRVGVALGIVATLSASGLAIAGTATAANSRSQQVNLPVRPHAGTGTAVTAGSSWTWYDVQYGAQYYCEVNSFDAGKVFTDDVGDAGKWKSSTSSTTLDYVSGPNEGIKFKGVWVTGDGYWEGNYTVGTTTYGPIILVAGTNPYSWGSC
jgi:hypothetical protein